MLCLYVYNVLPPQRLPGSFEDRLCNGQRKIKETRFKKKKKRKKSLFEWWPWGPKWPCGGQVLGSKMKYTSKSSSPELLGSGA